MRALLTLCAFSVAVVIQADELHDACRRGDLDSVKRALLADPSGIDRLDERKLTPLMCAVRTNIAVVEFLLSKGADVNAKGFMGATALHFAATYHNAQAMSALLEHGADVNARQMHNSTPAMFAANKLGPRRKEALKVLIDHHADLTLRSNDGESVGQYARMDPDLAKILKELNAKY